MSGETGQGGAAILDRRWLVWVLCLAAALPFALAPVLPLTDAGGHLGRMAVQLDGGQSRELAAWYDFQWALIPNLGTDLLVAALGPLLGVEQALRLVAVAIPVLQVAGFLLLARELHERITPTAVLALPLAFNFTLLNGFLNFGLGMALAFLAIAGWVRLTRTGRLRLRSVLSVPTGFALWLCHLESWAVFGLVAFGLEAARFQASGLGWVRAAFRAVPAMALLLSGPLAGLVVGDSGASLSRIGYDAPQMKAVWLMLTMWDKSWTWDGACGLVLVGAAIWAWLSPHFERDRALACAALLLFAAYLAMPSAIHDSHFADARLAPFVLALFLIAARPSPDVSRKFATLLAIAALVFTGLRWTGNLASSVITGEVFARTLKVLDAVPRGSQLVTIYVESCKGLNIDRRLHLSGYALARRHAFDNAQWQIAGGQLLRVNNPAAGPFQSEMAATAKPQACGGKPSLAGQVARIPAQIGHMWVIGEGAHGPFPGWSGIKVSGDSAVYARD